MAYISNDGMSLFYRVATSAAPLCTTSNGSQSLGPLTMMIDCMAPSLQAGPANSELGFKFPLCLQNQSGTYGATLGILWQDATTLEGMTCRDDKHGNYPGAGPTISADGIQFVNPWTGGGQTWLGFPRGRWVRLILRTERKENASNMREYVAVSGTNGWSHGGNKTLAAANLSPFDRICIGGRHRASVNAAFTLTAAPTAANSGTLSVAWNDFSMGSDATNGVGLSWADIATVTFNGGATRTITGVKNGGTTLQWGGAAVTDASANIQINTVHPNAFIQPNMMVANATFWDKALPEQDIHRLLQWGHVLSTSVRPYEWYPLDMDEGTTPRDRMHGFTLTQLGTGLEFASTSLAAGRSTFNGITSLTPPVITPSRWMTGANKMIFALSLAPTTQSSNGLLMTGVG